MLISRYARIARSASRLTPYTTSANATKLAARQPVILALDFDETLTTQCTLASVVAVAKRKHGQVNGKDFQWFSDEYMKDLCLYEAQYRSAFADQATPTAWSREMLGTYLEGLRPVEEASLERLSIHKVLAGVTRKEFYFGGRCATIRPGAAALVNKALGDYKWRVSVVSTNWSEDFIRGALGFAGANVASSAFSVHCNSLEFASDTGLSTGKIEPSIVVAKDKVDLLIRWKHGQEDAPVL
ncbi:hypothetical protein GGI20_002769 [Coemansia sp. BCRC 34301]|nr:hypothetical protein GGI20_002769 [Coemansia sp. BCRC 34301]